MFMSEAMRIQMVENVAKEYGTDGETLLSYIRECRAARVSPEHGADLLKWMADKYPGYDCVSMSYRFVNEIKDKLENFAFAEAGAFAGNACGLLGIVVLELAIHRIKKEHNA